MIDYLKIPAIDEAVKRGLDNSFKVPKNYDCAQLASFLMCDAIREAKKKEEKVVSRYLTWKRNSL